MLAMLAVVSVGSNVLDGGAADGVEVPPSVNSDLCFRALTDSEVEPCSFDYTNWAYASKQCLAGTKYSVFVCRCVSLAMPPELACRTATQRRVWRDVQAEKRDIVFFGVVLLRGDKPLFHPVVPRPSRSSQILISL